jgi:hypothetical protein
LYSLHLSTKKPSDSNTHSKKQPTIFYMVIYLLLVNKNTIVNEAAAVGAGQASTNTDPFAPKRRPPPQHQQKNEQT